MHIQCLIIFQLILPSTLAQKRTPFYAPNPGYDPFWTRGDWVFGTTSGTTTTSTPDPSKTDKTDFPYLKPAIRPLVCGVPCQPVYKKINAQVCGQVVSNIYDPQYSPPVAGAGGLVDWRGGGLLDRNAHYLRTFDNYCQFQAEQCRANVYHGMGIIFIHMGECLEDQEVSPPLYLAKDVKDRKQLIMTAYENDMARRLGEGKRALLVCPSAAACRGMPRRRHSAGCCRHTSS